MCVSPSPVVSFWTILNPQCGTDMEDAQEMLPNRIPHDPVKQAPSVDEETEARVYT